MRPIAAARDRYDEDDYDRWRHGPGNAMRVVEGARHLPPARGDRMLAATFLECSVFTREFLPEDLKLEVEKISREEAMKAARYSATVVGKAHARQMTAATRTLWHAELGRNRSADFDAPNW